MFNSKKHRQANKPQIADEVERMIDMRTWTTALVEVVEVAHDYDLHAFDVYKLDGDKLGTVYPADLDDMQSLISDLDNGACPIADGWEDGMGNTCGINGWGEDSGN